MNSKIASLFEKFYFMGGTSLPVMVGRLPKEIIETEISCFVEEGNKIKNNPLYFLKEHKNFGENSFQVSVPPPFIETSFLMSFLNHLGEFFVSKTGCIPLDIIYRKIILRDNIGHFDRYDLWLNYAYLNDRNPPHTHSGLLSGVIYVKNTEQEPTHFTKDNISFHGKPGDIIIFPSNYEHEVRVKKIDNERITIAFNLGQLMN